MRTLAISFANCIMRAQLFESSLNSERSPHWLSEREDGRVSTQ